MPDSEPNVDAPTYILAGDIDMQVFFDQLGMGWMTPWMPPPIPRLVVVEELCALPQPSAVAFTGQDIVRMREGDDAAYAARLKLANFVDRQLWFDNCRYVDATPAEPVIGFSPPPDLPAVQPPPTGDKLLREMWQWLEWMRRMMVPREYLPIGAWTVTGTGTINIPGNDDGDWFTYAAGVQVFINEKPDWIGQSATGSPAVYFNAGYYSLGDANIAQPPIRLQRLNQMSYGSLAQVTRFTYNLLPGVEITMIPLYPVTTKPNE